MSWLLLGLQQNFCISLNALRGRVEDYFGSLFGNSISSAMQKFWICLSHYRNNRGHVLASFWSSIGICVQGDVEYKSIWFVKISVYLINSFQHKRQRQKMWKLIIQTWKLQWLVDNRDSIKDRASQVTSWSPWEAFPRAAVGTLI